MSTQITEGKNTMQQESKSDLAFDRSEIDTVRAAWIEAMKDGNVGHLAALVTDDFVAIHGNGQCVSGKAELKADFLRRFELFDAEPKILTSQLIVCGKWAIEIGTAEVKCTGTPIDIEMEPRHVHFRVVVVFARQSDGSWKVARAIELPG